jgi:hypothetical protein
LLLYLFPNLVRIAVHAARARPVGILTVGGRRYVVLRYTAAAGLLTSSQIKDGTIRNHDIHKKTISLNRLTPGVQRLVSQHSAQNLQAPAATKGDAGPAGPKGAAGAKGDTGPKGDRGETGAPGLDSDVPRVVDDAHLRGFILAPAGDNGDTSDNGTVSFATPPVAPSLGTQALKFTSTTGKPVVAYAPLPQGHNPLIAELTHASYESLIESQPQSALDVSLQLEVTKSTSAHFASGYTTVVFEPYQNDSPETLDEWHGHSFDRGKVWSTQAASSANPSDCTQADPCPFSTFALENPNAIVQTVKLRIGQNSGDGWPGFVGYVDDFSLGFGPVVRYDLGG